MSRNPYVGDARSRQARHQGYPARSVFKLEEIDRRFRLLRRGARVLDLGCAPGSWSIHASRRVGRDGLVLGVDLQEAGPSTSPQLIVARADASSLDEAAIREMTGGRCPPFDLVLSDMAPSTTGVRLADHTASMELCAMAHGLAREVLRPGGAMVLKAFEGPDLRALEDAIRPGFDALKRVKPRGTRARSVEIFLVARGRRA